MGQNGEEKGGGYQPVFAGIDFAYPDETQTHFHFIFYIAIMLFGNTAHKSENFEINFNIERFISTDRRILGGKGAKGMNSTIRKFIFRDLQTVEGYIDPPDALVFLSLLKAQTERGLNGGIAEIGVYYGRTYFLFRKISGKRGRILAIDLFDIEQAPGGAETQYSRFIDNGRRLGLPIDEDLVIRRDSARVQADEIVGKIGYARFFSIDGGHMLHHVTADSRLAADSLADHGIIAFDDTFNPAWPEVTVGLADFLRQREGTFSAFCMTKYRTYVCRSQFYEFYCNVIKKAPDLLAFEHLETQFLGSKVARLHNPLGRRILYELMVRSGMSVFSERVYR